MFQPCYWLSTGLITDQGCSAAELDKFQGTEVFQNVSVTLEIFCFRKVNLFQVISFLFGLVHLILPMAFVSRQVIICSLGIFYNMSLISNSRVSDDSELS